MYKAYKSFEIKLFITRSLITKSFSLRKNLLSTKR